MEIVFAATFLVVTTLVAILGAVYFKFAKHQNYSEDEIIEYFKELSIKKPSMISLKNIIRKVNGWNYMTCIYSILYYSLNVLSITYSCIGIYFSLQSSNISLIASILSLISISLNLFFHCGNKWGSFREVLAKSRIATDNFLKNTINCYNLDNLINDYTNEIINMEKDIKNSDLL